MASSLVNSASNWNGLRVGVIVARHGHTAAARNQLKRRLRELTRLHLLGEKIVLDVVLRTRADAYVASFAELRAEIKAVASHLEHWCTSAVFLP